MRLWFASDSEVPLYRQLVTQVELAILSGSLQPGDKLPSTRELARRFALHPNTISAGYRQLERDGWTERRHGSGVYIKDRKSAPSTPEQILDQHIAGFFRAVRELQLPPAAVRARVAQWIAAAPPDHLLLIDPDPALRRILLTEMRAATSFPIVEASLDDCTQPHFIASAIAVCRPSKTELVRAALPPGVELATLPITAANTWLSQWLPAPSKHLVGVVSHWPEFLAIARTMLSAVGFPADALLFRDPTKPDWRRGLDQVSALLCDAHTAMLPNLPRKPMKVVFPLLSEAGREMLAQYSPPL